MNLGFKNQFVAYVEEGSKTHTIRGGTRWHAGMRADLFAEPRRPKVFADFCSHTDKPWSECSCWACERGPSTRVTRQVSGMRLLFRAPVVKVETIEIRANQTVIIAGIELSADERALFAWKDGFRPDGTSESFPSMIAFWKGRLPFTGQIIHWDYSHRFTDIRK